MRARLLTVSATAMESTPAMPSEATFSIVILSSSFCSPSFLLPKNGMEKPPSLPPSFIMNSGAAANGRTHGRRSESGAAVKAAAKGSSAASSNKQRMPSTR